MARLAKRSQSPSPRLGDNIYDATPEPSSHQRRPGRVQSSNVSLSPSPPTSLSSDKENRSTQRAADKGNERGYMPPPRLSTPISDSDRAGAGKRKRVEVSATRARSRRRRNVDVEEEDNDIEDAYDPEQDVEERRRLRRELRNIHRDVNDNRAEYLKTDSTGLIDALIAANRISEKVKQTTDATIDSRLLVTVGDLSYKKTVQLTLGESAQGVDLDEFVMKTISFMRRSEATIPDGTQTTTSTQRRRIRQQNEDSEDEDGDAGDENNWEHLGRQICLQHNSRPSLPGFLLGPLSLEKQARKVTQRRQGLNINNLKQTQPEVITVDDIEKAENANLTVLCTRILGRLKKVATDGMSAVETEAEGKDLSTEEVKLLMEKYGVHESGGVDLFKFVINPYSFGQTVENLFYVSFLIRDGKAGISMNEDGLPGLEVTEPRSRTETSVKDVSKHQAVFAIDMAQWKELTDVFNIKEPMIPHRKEEVQENIGARGWYS